jgi:hypothetical protein
MKPMLLGMNSPDPGYEVLDPTVGSGLRLVELIGRDAFDKFDRSNILDRRQWSRVEARARADMVISSMKGHNVVVLGNEAWSTLSLPSCRKLEFIVRNSRVDEFGDKWYKVPHPSGRNLLYNDQKWRDKARNLLREIAGV